MEWRDSGFVLSARRHGENALIAELLTREHGRHAGLVRGGQSPRRRALLQPGNEVAASWRGRLPEHLGSFECELVAAHAAALLDDGDRLAALNSAAALLLAAVPEREPQPDLHASFAALLAALTATAASAWQSQAKSLPLDGGGLGGGDAAAACALTDCATVTPPPPRPSSIEGEGGADSPPEWAAAYVLWECGLLAALGFGLDLGSCAATGTNRDLAYVSPRSGRAVSRDAGLPYHDKLLPLPAFLWRDGALASAADIVAGLILARHFLLHHLLEPQGGRLPAAREAFADRMRRRAAAGITATRNGEGL